VNATTSFFEAVPVEMHGHRKKLEFFAASLRGLAAERGLSPSDIAILEVGCSNGRNVALPLAELGYEVTGLDVHEPSIAAANAANSMSNARFLTTELSELPSDRRYTVVILSDVLEHVDDPDQMIARGLTHLTPDGIVLVSIPNGYGPFEIERLLFHKRLLAPVLMMRNWARWIKRRVFGRGLEPLPPLPAYNWESGHVQFFTRRSFQRLLAGAGLRIRRMANGCLFGGEVTSYLHAYWPAMTPRSLEAADHLPGALVSTWYFECERAQPLEGTRHAG
jgi:SAM-dependent methyltransferase